MYTYLFYVTIRVEHEGLPKDFPVTKGYRTYSEHLARRHILDEMLKNGAHVVSIKRMERTLR